MNTPNRNFVIAKFSLYHACSLKTIKHDEWQRIAVRNKFNAKQNRYGR